MLLTELLVEAFRPAPLAFGPKSLTSSVSVGNIPGDPSPKPGPAKPVLLCGWKSRAQDDSALKVGNSLRMEHTKN